MNNSKEIAFKRRQILLNSEVHSSQGWIYSSIQATTLLLLSPSELSCYGFI